MSSPMPRMSRYRCKLLVSVNLAGAHAESTSGAWPGIVTTLFARMPVAHCHRFYGAYFPRFGGTPFSTGKEVWYCRAG